MEAVKDRAPSKSASNNGSNSATATSVTKAKHAVDDYATSGTDNISNRIKSSDCDANNTIVSVSEDVLLFGARSSHLFDNIAIAIDSLLTEEVATLPLLPRKLTERELRQHQQQQDDDDQTKPPQTGEQKLIARLRKAYKKNIDAAETYCNRNIFTVQNHSKTKRRQILEQYFNAETRDVDVDHDADGGIGNPTADESTTAATTATSFAPPLPDGIMELPSPDTIMDMDKEILETRQRIQHAKRRRIQQTRQLGRLRRANQLLEGVLKALQMIEKLDEDATTTAASTTGKNNANDKDVDIASLMQSLKKSVLNAMEGHEELKIWNVRAEEVLQLLDKIKIDRDEMRAGGIKNHPNANMSRGNNAVGGTKVVAEREEDERRRKNTLQEMGTSHGTKEQVASLLNKLRGN